jgi:hypothetical protein
MKSEGMRWARHGKERSAGHILIGNLMGGTTWGNLIIHVRADVDAVMNILVP